MLPIMACPGEAHADDAPVENIAPSSTCTAHDLDVPVIKQVRHLRHTSMIWLIGWLNKAEVT